jgi:hypothetical protein
MTSSTAVPFIVIVTFVPGSVVACDSLDVQSCVTSTTVILCFPRRGCGGVLQRVYRTFVLFPIRIIAGMFAYLLECSDGTVATGLITVKDGMSRKFRAD